MTGPDFVPGLPHVVRSHRPPCQVRWDRGETFWVEWDDIEIVGVPVVAPSAEAPARELVADKLAADTHYRNQFETGTWAAWALISSCAHIILLICAHAHTRSHLDASRYVVTGPVPLVNQLSSTRDGVVGYKVGAAAHWHCGAHTAEPKLGDMSPKMSNNVQQCPKMA